MPAFKYLSTFFLCIIFLSSYAQKKQFVEIKKENDQQIDILINKKPFTSFLFGNNIEKPVLYPIRAANGTIVTRGFPLSPLPGEPTDHPHHLGIWFNYENVNGLDFWNNSYAIPQEKKHLYGWIKTSNILKMSSGDKGILSYHANWVNQANRTLLEETTTYEFSGIQNLRIIDRTTVLKADTTVLFKDAKDGMLAIRVAHELQIPSKEEQSFKDDKGNVTIVPPDTIANGNYITSEGKQGDSVWSTRAPWCKMYGKIANDSVSITIIDHPGNINYPTYWHARGYGLFAANPLGESIFTNGNKSTNARLQKGDSLTFKYRIIIQDGKKTISPAELKRLSSW